MGEWRTRRYPAGPFTTTGISCVSPVPKKQAHDESSARNKNNNSPAADVIAEGDPISAVSVQAGEEEPRLGRIPVARVVPAAAAGGLLSCLLAAFGHLADCEIVSE